MEAVYDIVKGSDDMDPTSQYSVPSSTTHNSANRINSLKGKRVGLPLEFNVAELSPQTKLVWNKVASLLESLGAELVPVSIPQVKKYVFFDT